MMTRVSIGDMAQSFMLRHQNTRLKSHMNTLVQELASGRTADVTRHLSGSYSYLADIERNLTTLDGYATATGEAKVLTGAMQESLNVFQTLATDLGLAAMSSASSYLPEAVQSTSFRAVGDLGRMIAAINTNVAGRALFSGAAVDRPPLASANVMLDDLRITLAGQTTLTGVEAAMDTWFDTIGGGFETLGYTGGTTSLSPITVGEGETLDLDLRGDNTAIRSLLKAAAMAALASDDTLGFDIDLQAEILQSAGESLALDQTELVQIRADLGYAEARVEDTKARISAEQVSFQIARTELLAVDPFETATELEDVQFQLESLYAVTVRLSRLSLVDYLR